MLPLCVLYTNACVPCDRLTDAARLICVFVLCVLVDVCSSEDLPEVEIISLLHEQIPRYRLRADTLTQFTGQYFEKSFEQFECFTEEPCLSYLFLSGYENQDWYIPTPALKPAETALTPDQIRETLNYFREYLFIDNRGVLLGGKNREGGNWQLFELINKPCEIFKPLSRKFRKTGNKPRFFPLGKSPGKVIDLLSFVSYRCDKRIVCSDGFPKFRLTGPVK